MAPLLSIVVPIYNEEDRLVSSLEHVTAYLAGVAAPLELILVDDGSRDRTPQMLDDFVAEHPEVQVLRTPVNRGKGHALRSGTGVATGDFILWMDLDLSTPIEDLAKLLPYLTREVPPEMATLPGPPEGERGAYDVAIGSRDLPESDLVKRQSWARELAGKLGNLAIRCLLPTLWRVHDTQCGFKLLKREVGQAVHAVCTIDRWGLDFEALHVASLRGYRIKEVPVTWRDAAGSKVSGLRDYTRTFRELAGVRWRSWCGRYRPRTAVGD
jgi:dolichyl-phosphate beta-glucosyltransferase